MTILLNPRQDLTHGGPRYHLTFKDANLFFMFAGNFTQVLCNSVYLQASQDLIVTRGKSFRWVLKSIIFFSLNKSYEGRIIVLNLTLLDTRRLRRRGGATRGAQSTWASQALNSTATRSVNCRQQSHPCISGENIFCCLKSMIQNQTNAPREIQYRSSLHE